MARQLQNMKNDVNVMLRDKTGGTVESSDLTVHFNKAIRQMKVRTDFQGMKRSHEFDVFSGVEEYAPPAGAKAYRKLYPLYNRNSYLGHTLENEFRTGSHGDVVFARGNVDEQEILLVRSNGSSPSVIDRIDGETGTWAAVAGTDAANVRLIQSTRFKSGAGYVFDIDVSASVSDSAAIQATDITSINLSGHESLATLFLDLSLPSVGEISSVTLRWGSSSSDYWEKTVTQQFSGVAFKEGTNVLGFDWASASSTGTPVASAVDYARVTVTYGGSQTDLSAVGASELRSALPTRHRLDYYSKYLVKASDGTYKEEFTQDDDTSLLEDWEDEIIVEAAAMFAFRQMRDFDDMTISNQMYEALFQRVTNDKPSEKTKPTTTYYKQG